MSKNNNTIELHHIGEILVKEFLQEINASDFISFLKNKSVEIYPNTKKDILKKIEACLKQSPNITPKIEVPFSIFDDQGNELGCDPKGLVDVCIFNYTTQRKTKPCLPIEVKMGLTGQAKSWSAFNSLNLGLAYQKESQKQIKGAVPSFLSKKFDEKHERAEELKSRNITIAISHTNSKKKKEDYVFDTWLICGRKSRKNSFKGKGINSHDQMVLPLWFSIEDLAEIIPADTREVIVTRVMDKAKAKLLRNFGINE